MPNSRFLVILALVAMVIALITTIAKTELVIGWDGWTSIGFILWLLSLLV